MNDLATEDRDSAAFWSQQAAERALKALLMNSGRPYGGHDPLEMAHIVEDELGIGTEAVMDGLRELTIHYIISRSPTPRTPSRRTSTTGEGLGPSR